MKKLIFLFGMFMLFTGLVFADDELVLKTGGGYINITEDSTTNSFNCWDQNTFKYETGRDCPSAGNSFYDALNNCQNQLGELSRQRDICREEKKILVINISLLENEVINSNENMVEAEEDVKDYESLKVAGVNCERDLAVRNTEYSNLNDENHLYETIILILGILVIVLFYIKFVKRVAKNE